MHDALSAPGIRVPLPILLATGADAVFAALRDEIVSGALPAATHLTEAQLCARFGLSTTPVREALQRLVHRGLAVRQVARGISVRSLTSRDIQDIYELRQLMEPVALRDSVLNLTAAQIASLGDMLTRARVALDRRDMLALSALNDQFHVSILEGAPNRLMTHWIEMLGDQRRLIAVREWASRDGAAREFAEHLAILRRIADRDPDGAATLLRHHITASADAPVSSDSSGSGQ